MFSTPTSRNANSQASADGLELDAMVGQTPFSQQSGAIVQRSVFDGLDPDKVIELLKKEVKNVTMNFTSPLLKNVPASYRTWNSLNGKQQSVVEQIYANLSGTNKAILKNAIEELSTKTTTATTFNDICRLMELRSYVGAQMIWTRALGVLERIELDADVMEPWKELADIFNDYDAVGESAFAPYNRALTYNEDGSIKMHSVVVDGTPTTAPVPRNPWISQRTATLLISICPCEKRPFRDGNWVKETYKIIKRDVAEISQKFFSSGKNKGCFDKNLDATDEWIHNFALGSLVKAYSFLVLDLSQLQNGMGKFLPPDASRESGLLDDNEMNEEDSDNESSPVDDRRKKRSLQRAIQRQNKKRKEEQGETAVKASHGEQLEMDGIIMTSKLQGITCLLQQPEFQTNPSNSFEENVKIAQNRAAILKHLTSSILDIKLPNDIV